jgi:hypothetical protein
MARVPTREKYASELEVNEHVRAGGVSESATQDLVGRVGGVIKDHQQPLTSRRCTS